MQLDSPYLRRYKNRGGERKKEREGEIKSRGDREN